MEFVQTAKDIFASEEWPEPKLASVKIWRCLDKQVGSHCPKCKSMVRSRLHFKVIRKGYQFVKSALLLLLVSKHKKFEDHAIAKFCCSDDNSQRWEKIKKKKKKKKKTQQLLQYQNRPR